MRLKAFIFSTLALAFSVHAGDNFSDNLEIPGEDQEQRRFQSVINANLEEQQQLIKDLKNLNNKEIVSSLLPDVLHELRSNQLVGFEREKLWWYVEKIVSLLKHLQLTSSNILSEELKEEFYKILNQAYDDVTRTARLQFIEDSTSTDERLRILKVMEILVIQDSGRVDANALSIVQFINSPSIETTLIKNGELQKEAKTLMILAGLNGSKNLVEKMIAPDIDAAFKGEKSMFSQSDYQEAIKTLAAILGRSYISYGNLKNANGILELLNKSLPHQVGQQSLLNLFNQTLRTLFNVPENVSTLENIDGQEKLFADGPYLKIVSDIIPNLAPDIDPEPTRQLARAKRYSWDIRQELESKGVSVPADATEEQIRQIARAHQVAVEYTIVEDLKLPPLETEIERAQRNVGKNLRENFRQRGSEGRGYYGGLGR